MNGAEPRFTVVAFHAHPDDESLLTGGTLAKAAAEGHRVVLVTATCGERGLARPEDGTGRLLAEARRRELETAAGELGCARVVTLDYGDSGLHPDPEDAVAFAHVDVEEAAVRLSELLLDEEADVLLTYDRHGGYGHPDHVRAHRVATRAAVLAGTPLVLEATVPGRLFRLVLLGLRLVGDALGSSAPLGTTEVFADPGTITHRVRVAPFLEAKRRAMRAHRSQAGGGDGPRMLDRVLGLPAPLFGLAFGHEWFIERRYAPDHHARHRQRRLQQDIFASLGPVGAPVKARGSS
jgi:LmbE family N-acetylglucosaminyl deacetylase